MSLPSKRDVAIIRATIRRIAVAMTVATDERALVPLQTLQHALVQLAKDAKTHQVILNDVAEDARREDS